MRNQFFNNFLAGLLLNSVPRSESSDSIRSGHSSPDSDFDEPWLSQVSIKQDFRASQMLTLAPTLFSS